MAPEHGDIPENDGMHQLRSKIQRICSAVTDHEERGQRLHILMTESYQKACERPLPVFEQKLQIGLPEMAKYEPRLQELPTELIEGIALNLELRDFGNLRLVSRVLHRDSTHAFRRVFFGARTVRMKWESLRQFVNMLNDANCGAVLRHVTIDCEQAVEDNAGPAGGPPHMPYGGVGGQARMNVPIGRRRFSYEPPALPSSSSRRLQELLERAFSRIDRLHSLSLTSDPKSFSDEREHLADQQTLRRALSHERLTMVLGAIAQGTTRISQLRIGGSPKPGLASFDYFILRDLESSLLSHRQMGLRRAFRDTTTLELVVYSDAANSDQFEPTQTKMDFIIQLFKLTPNLQSLDFCLGSSPNGDAYALFEELSQRVKLPHLTRCALRSFRLTTPLLKKFLSSSPAITEVRLDRVDLLEADTDALQHLLGNEVQIQRGSIRRMAIVHAGRVTLASSMDWEPTYPARWVAAEDDGAEMGRRQDLAHLP